MIISQKLIKLQFLIYIMLDFSFGNFLTEEYFRSVSQWKFVVEHTAEYRNFVRDSSCLLNGSNGNAVVSFLSDLVFLAVDSGLQVRN